MHLSPPWSYHQILEQPAPYCLTDLACLFNNILIYIKHLLLIKAPFFLLPVLRLGLVLNVQWKTATSLHIFIFIICRIMTISFVLGVYQKSFIWLQAFVAKRVQTANFCRLSPCSVETFNTFSMRRNNFLWLANEFEYGLPLALILLVFRAKAHVSTASLASDNCESGGARVESS